MSQADSSNFMADTIPLTTPQQRRDAALTLAETAIRLNDSCGLSIVLEVLSLKEASDA